jgi:hypothetical protein
MDKRMKELFVKGEGICDRFEVKDVRKGMR